LIAESSRHASPVDPDTGYQDVRRTIRYQASEIEVSPNKKWALFKATCWETVCPQVYDTETSEIHFIDPGYTNEITWLADNRLRFEGWCDYPGTICHEDVYESASADRPWEMQLVSTGAAETQGWQTYRNDEFGFEVGYPYNYFISDIEGGGVRIAHEKWEEELVHHPFVFFQVLETDKSAQVRAEEIIQQNKDGGFGIIEEGCSIHCVSNRAKRVTVGDTFSGWSYEIRGASGGTEYIILEEPLNSSALLEIGDHTAGSRGPGDSIVPQEVFDQILSTFRFMR